ncbi:unnamed protein product [Notodromas monacha]|uniref:Uncharacterized protein n=1 Tax=Notodromas monacha TaxID=399045 RepID=A0A7R9GCT5_9CRUS|nr:unnamed protein product [Notodromas monacha]CAG0917991.1 unnamed protein product [Notodromas monacha]
MEDVRGDKNDKSKHVLDLTRYPIPAERPSLVHRGYWRSPTNADAHQEGPLRSARNRESILQSYTSYGFAVTGRNNNNSTNGNVVENVPRSPRDRQRQDSGAGQGGVDGAGVASLRYILSRPGRSIRRISPMVQAPGVTPSVEEDRRAALDNLTLESSLDADFYEILSNPSIPSANDGEEADDEAGSTTTPVVNSPSAIANSSQPALASQTTDSTQWQSEEAVTRNRLLRWAAALPRHGVDAFTSFRPWRRPSMNAGGGGSSRAPTMTNNATFSVIDSSDTTTAARGEDPDDVYNAAIYDDSRVRRASRSRSCRRERSPADADDS